MAKKSEELHSKRTLDCIQCCDEILAAIDSRRASLLGELNRRYSGRLGDQPDAFGAVLSALEGELAEGRGQLVEVQRRHQRAVTRERDERQERDAAISELRTSLTPARSLCDRLFGRAFSDQVGFMRKVPYSASALLRKTRHVLGGLAAPDLKSPEPLLKGINVTAAIMVETLTPPYDRLRQAAIAVAREHEEEKGERQVCVAATGETEEMTYGRFQKPDLQLVPTRLLIEPVDPKALVVALGESNEILDAAIKVAVKQRKVLDSALVLKQSTVQEFDDEYVPTAQYLRRRRRLLRPRRRRRPHPVLLLAAGFVRRPFFARLSFLR